MSKRKVYQSIGFLNLTHSIKLEEGKKRIEFTGGTRVPKLKFGQFVTTDKAIQKALESDPLFKTTFKLLKVDDELVEKIEVVVTLEKQLEEAREVNTNLQLKIEELEDSTGDELSTELDLAKKQIEGYKKEINVLGETLKEHKATIETLENAAKEQVAEKTKEDSKETEVEIDVVKGVANFQAARQYLIKNHKQDFKNLPNGKAVQEVAKNIGVQFPDWNWNK